MKRCAAIQVLAAKATMTIALAHCISHSRELVTKVHRFEIFAIDAARGVTGYHDSRRRDNHQGQSGEHDADQFQGAFICHCKTSFQGRPRKAWPALRLGPFLPPAIPLSEQREPNNNRRRRQRSRPGRPRAAEPAYTPPPLRLPSLMKRRLVATCSRCRGLPVG